MATRNKIQTQLNDEEYYNFCDFKIAVGMNEADALRTIVGKFLGDIKNERRMALEKVYVPYIKENK